MEEKIFNDLIASAKEASEISKGNKKPSRIFKFSPPDIVEIRRKLHCSQARFALMIGVSKRTLQNWEQGKRRPTGPARALLRIAARKPGILESALKS